MGGTTMKSWNSRIYDVDNPMDLLAVAREFLDSWEPESLALVPEHFRPQRIKGLDDIGHWHQRLVDCYCTLRLGKEQREKVREMLHFFAFAVQRMAEIDDLPPMGEHEAAARLFSERSVPKLFTSTTTGSAER